MTDDCISLGPCAPELCRAYAFIAACNAVVMARWTRRGAAWRTPGLLPADLPAPNILENATRAAYEILEPWYVEHTEERWYVEHTQEPHAFDDPDSAPPDELLQAAVHAAAHQLYR